MLHMNYMSKCLFIGASDPTTRPSITHTSPIEILLSLAVSRRIDYPVEQDEWHFFAFDDEVDGSSIALKDEQKEGIGEKNVALQ